jgi:hypothetical protein
MKSRARKRTHPCVAFVSASRSASAWRPCGKRAKRDGFFCQRHERQIAGVILGICVNGAPDRQQDRKYANLFDLPVASKVPS